MHDDVANRGLLQPRRCTNCGGSLEGKRRHARYCSSSCRVEAHQKRQMNEGIRAAQEQGVADVERQLADGNETIYVEGRALSREGAWLAVAGIRAMWEIPGARYTGQHANEGGQWWALVQVPLGKFPG